MTKEFERYLIVFLCLILIGLSGCITKQKPVDTSKEKAPTEIETIQQLDAIVNVLGCMFDPRPCQKSSKKLQQESVDGNAQ